MTHPIVYIDISAIREGKLAELEMAMEGLVAFVEENVPRLISYAFFLNESGEQMTVVAVHPDSASLEFHLDVGGAQFRKFAELIELSRIDIYGQVSDSALERINRKAKMLGRGVVAVHEFFAGFYRSGV
jgi:hypothetical protein